MNTVARHGGRTFSHDDARFLAGSWADVRDLLAEVRRLRAENAALRLTAKLTVEGLACEWEGVPGEQPKAFVADLMDVARYLAGGPVVALPDGFEIRQTAGTREYLPHDE